MKKLLLIIVLASSFSTMADESFTFVEDEWTTPVFATGISDGRLLYVGINLEPAKRIYESMTEATQLNTDETIQTRYGKDIICTKASNGATMQYACLLAIKKNGSITLDK